MKRLITTIKWDLTLQAKNNILTIAIIIAALYTVIFMSIPTNDIDILVVVFVFFEPTTLGFIFLGAIIIFEKRNRTLSAVVVTPLKHWQYLWSKAISLSLIGLLCGLAMGIIGHGFNFNYLFFSSGIVLSSILFIFMGFIVISRIKTFNEFMISSALYFTPISLPLLNFFNITDSLFLYLIPSQASLILLESAFKEVEIWKIIYSYLYLATWIIIMFFFAKKAFVKKIISK